MSSPHPFLPPLVPIFRLPVSRHSIHLRNTIHKHLCRVSTAGAVDLQEKGNRAVRPETTTTTEQPNEVREQKICVPAPHLPRPSPPAGHGKIHLKICIPVYRKGISRKSIYRSTLRYGAVCVWVCVYCICSLVPRSKSHYFHLTLTPSIC